LADTENGMQSENFSISTEYEISYEPGE